MYRHYSNNFRKAIEQVYHNGGGEHLKANVSRFAAYKAYRATQIARRKQVDKSTGEIRNQKEAARATLAQFQAWQDAEYNTAVARARTAKQWELYNQPERRRLFPNIKWLESTSAEQRPEHQLFYNRIWAKDDPFWATNTPGTLWNCKCGMQETADDVTDNSGVPTTQSLQGLKGNPGITGEVFSDDASYFQGVSEEIAREANKVVFNDLKEWALENLKGKTVQPKGFDREIRFSGKGIKEFLHQSHDNYYAKNEMVRSLDRILENSTYRGLTTHKGRNSHIFSIDFLGRTNYLIANLQDNGVYFHSITESNKVLQNIRK